MQSLDLTVLTSAKTWLEEGRAVWLCTVIHTYGSSPRSPGSLFVATSNGQFSGSLSGGCIESDFLQRIADHEFTQPSQMVRYGEGGAAPVVRLPCGGSIDVLVEYLTATEAHLHYISEMLSALMGTNATIKTITLSQEGELAPAPTNGLQTGSVHEITQQDQTLTLYLSAASQLIVAGLSSVAHFCIDFALALGFEVIVCEPREEERRQFLAEGGIKPRVTLLDTFPALYLEQHSCHANTAIISLTHDPRMDDLTMMEAVNTPAFYLGVMGSANHSVKRLARLESIGGLSEEQLARIHAPIGLDIGSKTPAEIALAIMADIIRVRNGK